MTPAVLFVEKRSIYKQMGLDCYDIDRDACTYAGPAPVVAHPPCRTWSIMRGFTKAPPCEKLLAFVALGCVRRFGGVLEHPKSSGFWPAAGLPMPGKVDEYGGYTLCVDQFWWGHKAQKATLLYIVGCLQRDLPPIPLRMDAIQYTVYSIQLQAKRKTFTGSIEKGTQCHAAGVCAMAGRYSEPLPGFLGKIFMPAAG